MWGPASVGAAMKSISPITHQEITGRAYTIWEQNGRPEGNENASVGDNGAMLSGAKNGSAKGKLAPASSRASAG